MIDDNNLFKNITPSTLNLYEEIVGEILEVQEKNQIHNITLKTDKNKIISIEMDEMSINATPGQVVGIIRTERRYLTRILS